MTSRACNVCGDAKFDVISKYQFGRWLDETNENLTRENFSYDILSCKTCSNCQADVAGGVEFINSLYDGEIGAESWAVGEYDYYAPYKEMVEFCLPYIELANTDKIADFGSGNGELLSVLHNDFKVDALSLLGVDFSNNFGDKFQFLEANLNQTPIFKDDKTVDGFQLGFCCHVLEHLWQPRNILIELREKANRNGYLYIETPDHGILNDDVIKHSNLYNAQHINYFTLKSLKKLAINCGWMVVAEASDIFGFVPRAKLLLMPNYDNSTPVKLENDHGGVENIINALKCYDKVFKLAAEKILDQAKEKNVLIWGVGGDLMKMFALNEGLNATLLAGKIQLFDSGLKNKKFNGITIEDTNKILSISTGNENCVLVISPRPERTRNKIIEAALNMGVLKENMVEIYVK
jgi:2-polyprenyl-3-methyl-5-hydroxy-6-metoxy-1,4-benzoquinol methylase